MNRLDAAIVEMAAAADAAVETGVEMMVVAQRVMAGVQAQ